jgi:hypothetical protein
MAVLEYLDQWQATAALDKEIMGVWTPYVAALDWAGLEDGCAPSGPPCVSLCASVPMSLRLPPSMSLSSRDGVEICLSLPRPHPLPRPFSPSSPTAFLSSSYFPQGADRVVVERARPRQPRLRAGRLHRSARAHVPGASMP